jgi:hypothetical protein
MRNAEVFNVEPNGIYGLPLPIHELYVKYIYACYVLPIYNTCFRFSISPVFISFI